MIKSILNYYRKKFAQNIIVIKLSGRIIADETALKNIITDVKILKESGMQPIIVHGGGVQLDSLSERLAHDIKKIDGRRVTDKHQIKLAKKVFGGSNNLTVISLLKKQGLHGIRAGVDGNVFHVTKRPIQDVDYGFVGDIQNVDTTFIDKLLKEDFIPVIPSLGMGVDGTIYNINADTICIELGIALKADKIIFFSNTDGILDANKQRISVISESKATELIAKKVITDGMIVKIQSCIQAVDAGVKRIHIVNGFGNNSLSEEIFSAEGVGTMIVSNEESARYEEEIKQLSGH
jgi:acetylglutamate kinase